MPAKNNRLRAYAYLLLTTLCWGAAFVIVAPALTHVSSFQFLFYRFALASLLLLPILLHSLRKKSNRELIWKIVGIELLGSVVLLAVLYEGLARTTAIEASLLATTAPIFIIIACIIFLREKQTRREWLGLAISFVGVIVLTALPLLNGIAGMTRASLEGNLLIIVAQILGAIYAITIKKHYKKLPLFFVATIGVWLGTIVFGALSFASSGFSLAAMMGNILQDWQHPSVVFASLYMAIFGSIVGLIAFFKGQNLIEASEASLFTYLQPLVYLPLGVLVFGGELSILQLVGLAVILIGVSISETRG